MLNTPLSILVTPVDWIPIPSTVTATVGSQTAIGGLGIIGHGNLSPVVAMTGLTNTSNPVPTASALKGGTIGSIYSASIGVQGGTSPYTFSVTAGALPSGLSLSTSGVISGTPITVETATFTVTVTDIDGNTGSQSFTIVITASGGSAVTNYGFFT